MLEASPLLPKSKAPLFELSNQEGEIVKLKEELKKNDYVLVYFYPRAMTPGCTTQACQLQKSHQQYNKLGIKVLGISPDKVSSLKKFSERDKLKFDLLSDVDNEVAKKFGVWGKKKFMGKTYEGIHRISFLIDSKGKIIYSVTKVNTKTHHQDILDLI